MKVVLDTNVLVAAFATRGLCEAVLDVCLATHELVLSEYILTELRRNLIAKLKLPPAQAEEIVSFMREQAALVEPACVPVGACRDPADLAVLGTAVAGGNACLVTGDRELLELGGYEGVAILTPRAFQERLV